MGLFYAYLTQGYSSAEWYILTFADREVADEWWRTISTPPSPHASHLKRISPQFYFQNSGNAREVAYFSSKMHDANQLGERMLVTYIYNCDGKEHNTIRPITITDHISGRWYFIRSKADPWSHWYLRVKDECLVCGDTNCDAVHVSSEYRTKFCVRVRNAVNDSQLPKDFVMIGSDEIIIAAPKGHTLHINDAEDLIATKGCEGETDLLFKDLKNRFISRAEKQLNGEVWEYVESVERGLGEAWELVD